MIARAEEIKLLFAEYAQIEKNAYIKWNETYALAEAELTSSMKEGKRFKNKLLKELSEKAWVMIEPTAPFDRYGDKVRFDKIYIEADGVLMRWEAEHPNDIVEEFLTFEELCKEC